MKTVTIDMVNMAQEIFKAKSKIEQVNNQFCTAKAYECAAALMMEILEENYEVVREIWAANTTAAENL